MKIKIGTIIFVATFVLSGCNQDKTNAKLDISSHSDSAKSKQSSDLKIETKSPDTTVKSWWAVLDYNDVQRRALCAKYAHDIDESNNLNYKNIQQVTNGATLAYSKPEHTLCTGETYSREISEVKTESETRAIVFATIKNSTLIPAGAQPTADDLKSRGAGFKFKYVLEKDLTGWKVIQVYKYNESNQILERDVWEAQYEKSNTISIPQYVYGQ